MFLLSGRCSKRCVFRLRNQLHELTSRLPLPHSRSAFAISQCVDRADKVSPLNAA
jgi:hypothetical protein